MEKATRDEDQSGRETKRTKECERNESDSTSHLQHLHQRQMQLRTTASKSRELEGKTLEGENSMRPRKIWKGSGRQHDVQHVRTQRKEFQDDMLTTTSVAIESESC